MILLELCCPPLPVMAIREETGERTVTNTHDMMSVFMIAAFRRQDGKENEKRRATQTQLDSVYQERLECCTTFKQAYAVMSSFMTEYLATYILPGSGYTKQDIRILPEDYISPHLREQIRSYCVGLRMVSGLDDQLPNHSVDSLFMDCVRSAVHKKRIVCASVLEGVGEGVGEERHDPQALKSCVEVL